MTLRDIKRIEKEVIGKMTQIKSGKLTPKDSDIARPMNLLKKHDEPAFEKLMKAYKEILLKNQD